MSHIIAHLTFRLRNALLCSDPHLDQQTLFVVIDRPASLKASYDVGNRASMPSVPPIRIRAPAIASALSNSKGCTHIYLDPTTYIPVVNTLGQVATIADPLSPVLVRKDRSLVFWQYEHHSIAQDVAETYHKLRHYARTYDCDKVTPRSTSPYTPLDVGERYATGSHTRAARRQQHGPGYTSGTTRGYNPSFAGNSATTVPLTVWTLPVAVTPGPARGRKRQHSQLSISTIDAPTAPPLADRGMLPLPRRSAYSSARLPIQTTHSLAETVMSSHVAGSGPHIVEQNTTPNRYGIGYSSNNTTSVSSSVSAQHITQFDNETVAVDDGSPHRTKRSRTSASVTPFSTLFRSATLLATSPTSTSPPTIPSGAWKPAPRPDKGKQRAMPREDESNTSSLSPSLRRKPQHVQPSRGRKRKTRHDDDADTSGPSHKRIAVSLSYTESSASPTPSQESAASPAASQGSAASSTSSQGSIADDLMCSACSKTFGRKDTKTRHLKRVLSCPLSQKLTVPCPHCGTHLTRDLPRHHCDEKKAYMEHQLQHKRA
ncbi:predicted protein [Postia placenta Mad-698-R]|uniref:Uncharacterized protein n=1 Tax=Postia placenta MAD-698-R-SB12 TaxID=670580 RepID=A0A1X6N0L0_9APHY|nr:hypothetical protein POSPLADRAFT_1046474 [Postia placenta MAD-698-R-SB12]EED82728.1 predicted protein [Postia placenta Mad-698-R]OSX61983.1 hypothetical protein POSPLADRAFT_1046474 [Postia placenta MAD-698-R-SB12]